MYTVLCVIINTTHTAHRLSLEREAIVLYCIVSFGLVHIR